MSIVFLPLELYFDHPELFKELFEETQRLLDTQNILLEKTPLWASWIARVPWAAVR